MRKRSEKCEGSVGGRYRRQRMKVKGKDGKRETGILDESFGYQKKKKLQKIGVHYYLRSTLQVYCYLMPSYQNNGNKKITSEHLSL